MIVNRQSQIFYDTALTSTDSTRVLIVTQGGRRNRSGGRVELVACGCDGHDIKSRINSVESITTNNTIEAYASRNEVRKEVRDKGRGRRKTAAAK